MICEQKLKKYCCRGLSKIENYDKAIADTTQTWQCHHRLETHNSDGEKRLVDISSSELIALGMYYDRPPEELIFMTELEHKRLHNVGKPKSEETKRKIGETNRGHLVSEEARKKLSEASKGKHRTEETKKKMAEAHKGKHHTEETKRKMSEAHKGKPKPKSEETKRKMSEAHKGKHWFNNGEICIRCFECPEGFTPGRL